MSSGNVKLSEHLARRVLIVSNVFPPEIIGGAEIVAHRQALALAAEGMQVSVLTASVQPANKPTIVQQTVDGLRVFRLALPQSWTANNFSIPAAEQCARAVLALVRPQAVHLHNVVALSTGLIPLARSAGARVVVTLHDAWGFCMRQTRLRDGGVVCDNFTECDLCLPAVPDRLGQPVPIRLRRDYIRWCLEQADDLVFPSESLRKSYVQASIIGPSFHTLSNGLDLASFPQRPRNPDKQVSFLSLATIAHHKGVLVLWDALEQLLADPDLDGRWSMLLGGDGPLATELRERFKRGALRAPVRWAGFVPRDAVPSLVEQADVAVLASVWPENQPVSLMESIASGAAQIGTRIGGIPELIEHGQTGLLVPPSDAAALAGAMRQLILQPDLVRRFSVANLARRTTLEGLSTVRVLARLLSARGEPARPRPHPTVLCWGPMEAGDSASSAAVYLRRLNDRVRLLWHDWTGAAPIGGMDALCIFGSHIPAGVVGRAVLAGVPIVAPWQLGVQRLPMCAGLVHTYSSQEEGLEIAARSATVQHSLHLPQPGRTKQNSRPDGR